MLAIMAGCFFDDFLFAFFQSIDPIYLWLFFILCILGSFKNRYFFLLVIFLLVILRLYYFTSEERLLGGFQFSKNYHFTGMIVDRDKSLDSWQYIVDPVDELFVGRILLKSGFYPDFAINDLVEIDCFVYRPEPIAQEGRNTFYYDKYLAKDKIFYRCAKPKIKSVGHPVSWNDFIHRARNFFVANLNILPEPQSAFAKAIILGNQKEVPKYITDQFSRTGLTHIISISGLHMVIIIWLMYALLGILGLYRQQVFIFLFLALLAYLYLISFISPALRSSAMILLALLGPIIKRQTFSLYSVVFLADLFVLYNPYFLLFDISFQLSFLAVFGLIFYSNFFNHLYQKIPNHFKLRETLAVTSAAQVFTWPLTAYYFGNFSVIAAVANFLALPLFPFILVFTILLAVFGQISVLGFVLMWPLDLLLRLSFKMMEILARFKYAAFNITDFDWQFLLLSFVFVIMLTIMINPQKYETPD